MLQFIRDNPASAGLARARESSLRDLQLDMQEEGLARQRWRDRQDMDRIERGRTLDAAIREAYRNSWADEMPAAAPPEPPVSSPGGGGVPASAGALALATQAQPAPAAPARADIDPVMQALAGVEGGAPALMQREGVVERRDAREQDRLDQGLELVVGAIAEGNDHKADAFARHFGLADAEGNWHPKIAPLRGRPGAAAGIAMAQHLGYAGPQVGIFARAFEQGGTVAAAMDAAGVPYAPQLIQGHVEGKPGTYSVDPYSGSAAPITVHPDLMGGGSPVRAAPDRKPSALEQKKEELRASFPDLSDQEISKLALGMVRVVVDPVTQQPHLVDLISGESRPAAGSGGGAAAPAAPAGGERAAGDAGAQAGQAGRQTLWDIAGEVAGIASAATATGAGIFGQLPGVEFGGETVEKRQYMEAINRELIRALSINPRFPVAEMEAIKREIDIGPSMWDSEDSLRAKMRGVDRALRNRVANEEEVAGDPAVPAKTRRAARVAAEHIRQYLAVLGVPQPDAAPGGQPAGPDAAAEPPAGQDAAAGSAPAMPEQAQVEALTALPDEAFSEAVEALAERADMSRDAMMALHEEGVRRGLWDDL